MMDLKDQRDLKELREMMDLKDLRVMMDLKDLRVMMVHHSPLGVREGQFQQVYYGQFGLCQ